MLARFAVMLAVPLTALGQTPVCTEGRQVSADTANHCCWPDQAWSQLRSTCVGTPACPPGRRAQGDDCVIACAAGQAVTPDTAGQCCWPGQAWSSARGACVGTPVCPAGLAPANDTCISQGLTGTSGPTPGASPGGAVGVDFRAVHGDGTPYEGGNKFEVTLLSKRTGQEHYCEVPCKLDVPAANYELQVRGAGRVNTELELAGPSAIKVMPKANVGENIFGVVAGFGLGFTIFSTAFLVPALVRGNQPSVSPAILWPMLYAGVPMLVGGLIGAAVFHFLPLSARVEIEALKAL